MWGNVWHLKKVSFLLPSILCGKNISAHVSSKYRTTDNVEIYHSLVSLCNIPIKIVVWQDLRLPLIVQLET